MIKIYEGQSVRELFKNDLMSINEDTITLMPESICSVMPKAVEGITKLKFYQVDSIETAQYPLEIDLHNLTKMINDIVVTQSKLVILFSLPFGYYDIKLINYIKIIKDNYNIYIALDLSQSYGSFSLLHLVNIVDSIYISFNGNKLVNTGGGIKLAKCQDNKNPDLKKYIMLQRKIYHAFLKQEISWLNMVKDLKKFITSHAQGDAFEVWSKKYENCLRASYHRTLLYNLPSYFRHILTEEGFGQSMLIEKQNNKFCHSENYLTWAEQTYLLFPKRRKDC